MILISLLLFTYNQSYAKSYHVFVSSSKSRRRVYIKGPADSNPLLHKRREDSSERETDTVECMREDLPKN